jgi:ATP-dependent DNA helicase RecG
VLQVGLARQRGGSRGGGRACARRARRAVSRYRGLLPFELTADQESAIREIDADLARRRRCSGLLQGDVGSGKTVVALYALLRAVEAGRVGALMAPTETLAEQHFLTIEPLCTQLGVRVALLTGSVKSELEGAPDRRRTHALIQEGVDLGELGVAVVDEQHRFRRGAAARLDRGPGTPRPAHDRDADPAHAGAHALRRPLRSPRSRSRRPRESRSSPRG